MLSMLSMLLMTLIVGMALLDEDRISFLVLARENKVDPATIWRWWAKGVRGAFLESFVIGGRRFTTRQAFARFVAATSGSKPESQTTRDRQRADAEADRILDKAGI